MHAWLAVGRRWVTSSCSSMWLPVALVALLGCLQPTLRELPDCEPAVAPSASPVDRSGSASTADPPADNPPPSTELTSPSALLSTSSPFDRGPLAVRTFEVAACRQGPPVPLRVHTPEAAGQYAVVLFHHGFMTRNSFYDSILTHVASHGLIVIAPQSYEPGLGALSGNPNVVQEAEFSRQIVSWTETGLEAAIRAAMTSDVRSDTSNGKEAGAIKPLSNLLTIGGHSRGGLAAWLVCEALPGRFAGIVGVDPVGGAGGRVSTRGTQPQSSSAESMAGPPAVILGAGLGGSCAPTGRNYEQFFAATAGPAWKIVAIEQGHGDMLDESAAVAAGQVCDTSRNRDPMRRLTAGLIVLTARRGALADATTDAILDGITDASPTPVVIERK
ncbi:MAG: hypothetical protein HRU75_07695 [Planctomycetia bacterium]|nr:MAG: hypothetical protein HRU75_07695 [Planctomycetia bacterium]